MNRDQLTEALAEFRVDELHAGNIERLAVIRDAARLLSEFPTDEQVEAGVQAVADMWGEEQVIRTRAYGWIRYALEAVARDSFFQGER